MEQQLKVLINTAQLMYMQYFCVGHVIFLQKRACVTLQFNGTFVCFKCLQPGCTVKVGKKGGHVHAFTVNQENIKGPLRTHLQCLANARAAVSQGKPV